MRLKLQFPRFPGSIFHAGLLGFLTVNLWTALMLPVQGAQTIVLRKGIFEASVKVSDLKTLVTTGKVPEGLQGYARNLNPQQRKLIFGALKTKIPLNILGLSNFIYSPIGEQILTDLGTVTPRRDGAVLEALRGALVLGALNSEGLSILSFIEAYPGQQIIIDIDRAFQVLRGLNRGFWETQRFVQSIAPQLGQKLPTITIPFDPTQPGSQTIQIWQSDLSDRQRNRTIPVDVYWSGGSTQDKPLIIFSHGLGSVRTDLRYLAEHLASYGYVVVALEHPGSNETNTNAALTGSRPLLKPQEFLERPKDISFVLDELTKINQSDANLRGRLATNNAMIVGYSFGGSTALSVAGGELQLIDLKRRCKDGLISFSLGETIQCIAAALAQDSYQFKEPRIRQAIALNPTTSLLFGKTGLSKIDIPTMMVGSSADKTTPALSEQVIGFTKMTDPKWLVGVIGGTHLSVKDPSATLDQQGKPNTPIFGDEVVGEKAAPVRDYIKAITLAMAAQMTPEAAEYAIFLTPEYAQLASKSGFDMRIVQKLPPEAQAVVESFIQAGD